MNLPAEPSPALIFFDMSTSDEERRYKRPVLPAQITNDQHAKQLEEIEHSLWVLCHHFKVFPEEQNPGTEPPEEKPPEMIKLMKPTMTMTTSSKAEDEFVDEIVGSVNPAKKLEEVVESALRKDNDKLMADIESRQDEFMRRMFELAKIARIAQQAEEVQPVQPKVKFDHSYSALTEIKMTVVKVRISDEDKTTVHDQYGIPWQLRFRQDMDWLVLDVEPCRHVLGRFRVLVRFCHESPLKTYPGSVLIDVNRLRTIYCGTLASVSQLQEDGYFAKDGTLHLRVAIIPMDPDAERSTHMLAARLKKVPPHHNVSKMPKFSEGHLAIADFSNSGTTYSPKLLDAQRINWQLVVMFNRNLEDRHRKHIGICIKRLAATETVDTCHEYFIELLSVNPGGWSYRQSGRMLEGTVTIPEFILKSRAEAYMKDDKLRIRWGVRRLPIR